MICRLCLEEPINSFEIFSDSGETEVAKTIAKYFHIEVQPDDIISNKICAICWQHLFDFHRYWLGIDEKQKTLQTHFACTQIKQDVDDIETAELPTTHISSPIDSKNNELGEPEIDMAMVQCNLYADGLEFEEAEMKDDETSMDRYSIEYPLAQDADEIATEEEIDTKSTKQRKTTKRIAKKIKTIKERNLKKTLRSVKRSTEKNKSGVSDLVVKVKKEKKQDTRALIQELDDFIAENTQLSCCLCSVPLKDFIDLKKHFRQVHDCVGYVLCCNNRYRKRTLYVDHLKLHKDPDFFKHMTATGRIISAKVFEAQEICKCCKGCPDKIDVLRQQEIFDCFYKCCTWTQKTLLIRTYVEKTPVSKKRAAPIIPLMERNYKLQYKFLDAHGISHIVCRDFFIKCLKITPSRIQRAVHSTTKNPSARETRGREMPKNKTTEQNRKNVINFINLFPKYESHYGRSTSSKQYLNPNMNLRKMYEEYKNVCEQKEEEAVSHYVFSEIFNNSFNLSFKRKHSDTCKTCDHYKCALKNTVEQNEIDELLSKKAQHVNLVETVNNEFKQDVQNAIEHGNSAVLTFDLQKTLETPSLTTSVAYYKRLLWTYNLCVYDEVKKIGYMYVWNESIASRGGQEIGSCLLHHFKNNIEESTPDIILYSDACSGQNRNIKITLLIKHFLASSKFATITQKYFVSGHSYNSCDRSFSLIEKSKKIIDVVAIPADWISIIKDAKKKDPKFIVKEMETSDFVSSKKLETLIVNRKFDTSGQKINWFKVMKIIQKRDNLFSLIFLTENVTHVVNIKKNNVSEEEFQLVHLKCLFPNGKTVTKAKYLDLLQLLSFIPVQYHAFYKNLQYENRADIDHGIASGGSDEEN